MRSFFVPIAGSEGTEPLLHTACLLARRFGGLIEGACVLPDLAEPFDLVDGSPWPLGERAPWTDQLREEERVRRETFEAILTKCGCSSVGRPGGAPHFSWHAGPLAGDQTLSAYARLFSLSVIRRPSSSVPSLSQSRFEALLFESGRPVLISPPTAPTCLGERILIAWNGSTETTRAVAAAMPLLQQAKHIFVVEVEGQSVPGPSARRLAAALAWEGAPAEGRSIPENGRSSGEIFLAQAQALDCDLIIKGAYTQSRLRQMFFGGATTHILHHADLPVLMAH